MTPLKDLLPKGYKNPKELKFIFVEKDLPCVIFFVNHKETTERVYYDYKFNRDIAFNRITQWRRKELGGRMT